MLSLLLYQWTGIQLFQDRLFRAGAASLFAALLVLLLMPPFIAFLRRVDATSDFEQGKAAPPPILGGMLVVLAVIAGGLIFSRWNAYSI